MIKKKLLKSLKKKKMFDDFLRYLRLIAYNFLQN